MQQILSDVIRRDFRRYLDSVALDGQQVGILRYTTPVAVLVPISWHERACEALAILDGWPKPRKTSR
jgi:antitoxin (DNA-binding transcriptional repressor) of toxin-antitoxin stability system